VVEVRSPQASQLRDLLLGPDVSITSKEAGPLDVRGASAEAIGNLAFEHDVRLHGLTVQQASLEDAFMELTRDSVEFHAHTPTTTSRSPRGSSRPREMHDDQHTQPGPERDQRDPRYPGMKVSQARVSAEGL
jgi:hypothetical protein